MGFLLPPVLGRYALGIGSICGSLSCLRKSTFLWKAVGNFLPVWRLLVRRGICGESLCPFCLMHEETVEHLLLGCQMV